MAMKLNADNPLVRHYDKLIVVVVLIGLVISLFYLTNSAGPARSREKDQYKRQIDALQPTSANLGAIGMSDYQTAEQQMRLPIQLELPDAKTAGFLVPETRVICVIKDCKKLIPYSARTCPFCGGDQPLPQEENPELDTDGDGIPDKEESKWGLNPYDASDASGDLDGDLFTNLEEYQAKTDLKDPKSHPPYTVLLRVKETHGKKLPMLFIGKNKMPDGKTQLQIKDISKQQTFYLYEGDNIGNSGFAVGALMSKTEKQDKGGNPVDVDISTVVVKRLADNKEVTLRINDTTVKETDVEAVIVLPRDNTEYPVVVGGTLNIRDETYRVLSVDSVGTTVTVKNEATEQENVIPRLD